MAKSTTGIPKESIIDKIKLMILGDVDVIVEEDEPEKPELISNEETKNNILATCIILLFMLHPQIVDKTLSLFNCRTYEYTDNGKVNEDMSLLNADKGAICWEGFHLKMAMPIAIIGIIVWDIGIIVFLY